MEDTIKSVEAVAEEVKEEKTSIVLTNEEKNVILQYQRATEDVKITLANLRRQYLNSENRLLAGISEAENHFVTHLRKVANSHGVAADDQSWIFDPTSFSFQKRKA